MTSAWIRRDGATSGLAHRATGALYGGGADVSAPRGARGPFAVLRRAKNVKNANDAERNALLDDAERIETWCANLVLGAIVLEAAVWISPLCPFLFKLGNFVSDAAVAIGIYGEMRFGHVAGDILKILLAEAVERAANAELETEKLKGQFAWRALSNETGQKLVSALSAYNGSATIEYISNDPEALYFAFALKKAFSDAGWPVSMMGRTIPNFLAFGLFVADVNAPQRDIVRAAFKISDIELSSIGSIPAHGMSMGNRIPGSVTIFVGSKKPEFV